MFRRQVKNVTDIIMQAMREQGLETPLKQKRLLEAWPAVAGEKVAKYTLNTFIYNQTMYVRLSSPALRAELSMRRQLLTEKMNAVVGEKVIVDICFN